MPLSTAPVRKLNLGLNLRGLTAGVNMLEGEATDAQDVFYREDGAFFRAWGWLRKNSTALSGVPVAMKGFTYKGKNNDATTNPNRSGNWGIADDSGIFTRRKSLWSGFILMTTTTFYTWDPVTETFISVSLPGGVTVDVQPKPSVLVYQDNCYIAGWASTNLRWDPTDAKLYQWGWEGVPPTKIATTLEAGGLLVANATYRYAYTFFDLYTGEESAMGDESSIESVTTTGTNRQVKLDMVHYAGLRHFVGTITDRDVGFVIYRSDADTDQLFFLTTVLPSITTYTDTGDATVARIRPFQGTQQDEPRFNMLEEYKGQFFGVSWDSNPTRVFYSDFSNANHYVERWRLTGFKDLPVPEGEVLTSLRRNDQKLYVFSQKGAFDVSVIHNKRRGQTLFPIRLPWHVGAVGPAATRSINGWLYFLSERGPYRATQGSSTPQWIGKNLAPLFIDPTSALCKLNVSSRTLSEVAYDKISDTVRFIFPVGGGTRPNTHLAYWIHDDVPEVAGNPYAGWAFHSPKAQCFDLTHALGVATDTGEPPSTFERQEHFIFGDPDGFVGEYDQLLNRGGLPASEIAAGTAQAGGTTTLLVATPTGTPLYTTGDGLKGMRLEVVYADGSTDIYSIASNTLNDIVPDGVFRQVPGAGDIWYVSGIPSFWRSWMDNMGDPYSRKRVIHLYAGYQKKFESSSKALDLSVAYGDFPDSAALNRSLRFDLFKRKIVIARTGTYFTWEFSNSRPDEPYTVMFLDREFEALGARTVA